MTQTERIYKIQNMLRRGRVVGFTAMQSTLEVSRSTLKRDLEAMRSSYNIPIEYDRAAGGYCLNKIAGSAVQAHELPGLWFSPSEIHALLTMQHLLTGLDAGGVLSPILSR